ncbi:hypothetical protein CPAR01_08121 [Colletotrichum paranaense]|uniref:Uncharacterized protein n=1 Tax=Colletotrichum paranaense TaxID=1914294 RepID=A0ABQ9SJG2_9PEZI|nr:uncharacterized protein CPAR01_08121 [Colletotrichum paranaense]KAK1538008.1 hypothetical protein CPAR01_08121 [Colletotrichum paranaense]
MQGTSNQSPVSSHLLIFPERRLPGSNTENPQPRTWSGLLSPAALWHSCSSADLLSCRLTRLATTLSFGVSSRFFSASWLSWPTHHNPILPEPLHTSFTHLSQTDRMHSRRVDSVDLQRKVGEH